MIACLAIGAVLARNTYWARVVYFALFVSLAVAASIRRGPKLWDASGARVTCGLLGCLAFAAFLGAGSQWERFVDFVVIVCLAVATAMRVFRGSFSRAAATLGLRLRVSHLFFVVWMELSPSSCFGSGNLTKCGNCLFCSRK